MTGLPDGLFACLKLHPTEHELWGRVVKAEDPEVVQDYLQLVLATIMQTSIPNAPHLSAAFQSLARVARNRALSIGDTLLQTSPDSPIGSITLRWDPQSIRELVAAESTSEPNSTGMADAPAKISLETVLKIFFGDLFVETNYPDNLDIIRANLNAIKFVIEKMQQNSEYRQHVPEEFNQLGAIYEVLHTLLPGGYELQ